MHIPVIAGLGSEAVFYFLVLFYLQGAGIAPKSSGKKWGRGLVRELESMECS